MRNTRMVIAVVACVALGAGVTWMAMNHDWRKAPPVQDQEPAAPVANNPAGVFSSTPATEPATAATSVAEMTMTSQPATTSAPASQPATATAPAPALTGTAQPDVRDAAAAKDAYEKGMKLAADNDLLRARAVLSAAVLSGLLPADLDEKAREQLTQLADATLLSSTVVEGDPYTSYYQVRSGENLNGIEKSHKLRVPTEVLVRINHLKDAGSLQADQRIKLLSGPFHAIVRKGQFTMDLYLQRDNLEKVWVKRVKVGLGKSGSTPEGVFQVGNLKTGLLRPGKVKRPPWTPTGNEEPRKTILYGQSGYAFGDKGLWIGLAGMEEKTRDKTDYAIHSTNMPNSIGKEESSGCIRLADDDIELVWSLLYDTVSTVRVEK